MPAEELAPLAKPSRAAHSQNAEGGDDIYNNGYFYVEHDNYYVACGGHSLKLPRKEFLIVSRLTRSAERIVPFTHIWQHAWGMDIPFNAESLHVHIYRLRRKLAPYNLQIETMVNVGYRLVVPTSATATDTPSGLHLSAGGSG